MNEILLIASLIIGITSLSFSIYTLIITKRMRDKKRRDARELFGSAGSLFNNAQQSMKDLQGAFGKIGENK